jgi:ubiquitin-activating enzyme E1
MIIENEKQEFDHKLYDRQVGTFGVETMNKFVKMRVLLLGLSGVGIELAKNLILAGPKSLCIYDPLKLTRKDLEFNYYATEQNIADGLTRVEATLPKLAELNNYVAVEALQPENLEELFSYDRLVNFDVIVVCEWYNLNLIKRLNEICNSMKKGFIFAATAGLAGAIFVDFGASHQINDKDGEECFTSLVSSIELDGIVTTHEGQRHGLVEGDVVKFTELVGMEKINNHKFKVQKVISPFSFSVGDLKHLGVGEYVRNGIVHQLKDPKFVIFNTLEKSLDDLTEELIDSDFDFEAENRMKYMKVMIHAYWAFVSEWGFSDFYDLELLGKFENFLSSKILASGKEEDFKNLSATHLHKIFFSLSSGNFLPVQSFFGAIAAQEIVKYTGKYTPIHQWYIHEWYWSSFKKVPFEDFTKNRNDVAAFKDSRYISHIALLGKALHDQYMNSNVFMVGAGALGCEYLKLFAITGLCCGKGQLVVTDDDTVEISNLNRQFLFRHRHVKGSKSEQASEEAKKMNPELKVVAKKNRVSPETENIFTDQLWDNLNFVVNAVDNIKARQYVDQKCVLHYKPLFEAGTLGTKCNSQLVLPGLTEAYSDSQDPQEKQVPMCTMRSFPFLIDHCIEWARAKFFDLFVQISKFLHEFFQNPAKGVEKFQKEVKFNISSIKELCENLVQFIPLLENPTPEMYVKFARDFYEYAFVEQIQQLLTSFPEDAKDKDGNLFWTSPKRPPVVCPFDINNPDHLQFIASIVNILQQFIVPVSNSPLQKFVLHPNELRDIIKTIPVRQIKIDNSEEARAKLIAEAANADGGDSTKDSQILMNICHKLFEISKKSTEVRYEEVEFEKDCDENSHIDFIAFTANARATNYKIQTLPRHRIKIIAGKIIPAIATTTSLVAAAVLVEIYKHFLQVRFDGTRNFFSNLAIPIFMFSEPSPPVVHTDKEYDPILLGAVKALPPKHNTWSRIEVTGPKTLNQIIADVAALHGFTVSSFVIAGNQIYSNYSPNLNYRLEMTVEDILKEINYQTYPGKLYVVISIGGETDDLVDVDAPYLKYKLSI